MSGEIARLQKELDHWKAEAEKYRQNYEAVQDDFNEFQGNSKDLEAELEEQLSQAEKKTRELQATNQKLGMECESLKNKAEALQIENSAQISRLEVELNRVRTERDDMQRYIRELEQVNDDLERAKRAALVSLEDFEKRLNETIERNAFLENELDERDGLREYVQRLKEETRDLRQELQVKDRIEPLDRTHTSPSTAVVSPLRPSLTNGTVQTVTVVEQSIKRSPSKPAQISSSDTTNGVYPLTPTARISALNIVGDLLRKVGALETKLAGCRRFSVDQNTSTVQQPPSGDNSSNSSPQKLNGTRKSLEPSASPIKSVAS